MEILENLQKAFTEQFGTASEGLFFSPGRVNLIGEHTDYNGGHVFPCAISLGTYAAVKKRPDQRIRLYSLNFPAQGVVEADSAALCYDAARDWANYPLGVVKILQQHGHLPVCGFDMAVYGNLPNGAGLSSSASLEVLTGVVLADLYNLNIDRIMLVKYAQEAENQFVGVNCGIMDQFSIGMGKKDCAILLDCNTLEYRYSHIDLKGCKIVIGNTNKRRGLNDSKYNERRSECEAALAELRQVKNIKALGELSNAEFDKIEGYITSTVNRRRARHAVRENQRTLEAVQALEQNDTERFGKLMNDSHRSLRDDYEVTGRELDTLVELAWQQNGVLGARMTGAGFGGCTVNLVKENAVDSFIKTVTAGYTASIGYAPSFYVADIADGAGKLSL